ncbi:hypothetical protein [Mongoliitalea daihaiensis]|uniref:hypothetical protein n=1 Tax=Mongoliitalea daihaiensis TaxID=2782006 RepID=UPI001F1AD8D0|nr:hypothetical protein [Mongoliitalea daihaiensis]UJP65008.1 hypothetical protein IPZ59_19890 [Mongoliitalea daihaiensis]
MQGKLSPLFQTFHQQFHEGKSIFNALSKQFRGKKAVELEQKLIFLEIYIDLLAKIHFKEDQLKFKVFSPFKDIFKGLKKVKHIRIILGQLALYKTDNTPTFNSYERFLLLEKNKLYTQVYDLIVGAPLKIWEDLYEEAFNYSHGIKPLSINTATTQIIEEELEFFNLENKDKLTSKGIKDIYEGVRVITALENLRIEIGFNAVFVPAVHEYLTSFQRDLLEWYENHLLMQHIISYLSEQEHVSKKYLELLAGLKENKKTYTLRVEKECRFLFDKIIQ